LFCLDHQTELSKDFLTEDDWYQIEQTVEALKPFQQATLRAEGTAKFGHHGSVWEALPLIETLLGLIERKQADLLVNQRGKTPSPLQVAYQNAWEKLQKYYNKTDEAHGIYAASILLHPSYRKNYFEVKWSTEELSAWREVLYQSVRTVWQNEYKQEASNTSAASISRDGVEEEEDPFEAYLADTEPPHGQNGNSDPFDEFISATPSRINNDHLLTWWSAPHHDPALKQLALDLFSIPAMSSEIERVFSSTKMLLTAQRQRINDNTIEEAELLRHWIQQGIDYDVFSEVVT
jgi:hypothetical protein